MKMFVWHSVWVIALHSEDNIKMKNSKVWAATLWAGHGEKYSNKEHTSAARKNMSWPIFSLSHAIERQTATWTTPTKGA